jgi:hypothetical protein
MDRMMNGSSSPAVVSSIKSSTVSNTSKSYNKKSSQVEVVESDWTSPPRNVDVRV